MTEPSLPELINTFKEAIPTKFSGDNITAFLEEYNQICSSFELSDKRKIQLFPFLCQPDISRQIRNFNSFKISAQTTPDWYTAEQEVIAAFKKDDPFVTLRELEMPYDSTQSLERYIQLYEQKADYVHQAITIPKYYKRNYFIMNLPADIQESISQSLTATSTYEEVKAIVLKHTNGQSVMDSITSQMGLPRSNPISKTKKPTTQTTEQVADLIDALGKLTLRLEAQTNNISTTQQDSTLHNVNKSTNARTKYCIYCESTQHYRGACPLLDEDIRLNRISIDRYGKICDMTGKQLSLNKGNGGIRSFILQEQQRQPSNSNSANYIELDKHAKVPTRDRYVLTFSEPGGEVHEYLMEPEEAEEFNCFIDKRKFPSSDENQRKQPRHNHKQTPVVEIPVQPTQPETTRQKYKYQMPIADNKAAQQVVDKFLRSPFPQLTNHKMFSAIQHLQQTLPNLFKPTRTEVNTLFQQNTEDKEEEPQEYTAEQLRLEVEKAYYSIATGTYTANIHSYEVECTFDSGSEINAITASLFKQINLPSTEVDWSMKTATGASQKMLGLCHSIPIEIGGVLVSSPFFIVSDGPSFQVLLGRPYERRALLQADNRPDGSLWLTITSGDRKRRTTFCAVETNNPRNSDNIPLSRKETQRDVLSFNTHSEDTTTRNVLTKYKPVAKKIRPVSTQLSPTAYINPQMEPTSTTTLRLTEERLQNIHIGNTLTKEERQHFINMLKKYDKVFAFTDEERGCLSTEFFPPVKIHTVKHTPWAQKTFPIPSRLLEKVVEMLKSRYKSGVIEYSYGPYRNPWFTPIKKNGSLRFIQDVQQLNKVTIKDAMQPPVRHEYIESFAGYPLITTIDLYSGYDQLLLDPESRDYTAMDTPIGLIRMTRIPQGWTNSVQTYQRAMNRVLAEYIPTLCRPFLDDIGIKNSTREKNSTHCLPNIRKYVLEHINTVEKILRRLQEVGLTISGEKSKFGYDKAIILGELVTEDGRLPDPEKLSKLTNWKSPTCLKHVREFLGLTGLFRIWIPYYAQIAEPLTALLRKDMPFQWTELEEKALRSLIKALSEPPVLASLDYTSISNQPIIVSVDSSGTGVGGILIQISKDKRRQPCKYLSRLFKGNELHYPSIKKEALGVLYVLKKLKPYLLGVHFTLEVDAKPLLGMLKKLDLLPDPILARWISYIQIFDFELKHIPGVNHKGPDALSRKKIVEPESTDEEEIDEFLEHESLGFHLKYTPSDNYHNIYDYLTNLQIPLSIPTSQHSNFKKKALKYSLIDNNLYRKSKNGVPRRYIYYPKEQQEVIQQLHESEAGGHKGIAATYSKVALRYYWPTLYSDIKKYVQTCLPCQKRDPRRLQEPLKNTFTTFAWQKAHLDITHLPRATSGYKYIVDCRDNFTGWVEARMLKKATAKAVSKFLKEDIFLRHGSVETIITDNGECGSAEVQRTAEKYGAKLIRTTPYHPQSNAPVERGHQALTNTLAKLSIEDTQKWHIHFQAALWADRITAKRSTGYSPFYLIYGHEAILPIDIKYDNWLSLPWKKNMTTEELLQARVYQIANSKEHLKNASSNLKKSRIAGKEYFDSTKMLRKEKLKVGDLVLLHDTKLDTLWSHKLNMKWSGPYKIVQVNQNGTYRLTELDNTPLASPQPGNRLKIFHLRNYNEGIISQLRGDM